MISKDSFRKLPRPRCVCLPIYYVLSSKPPVQMEGAHYICQVKVELGLERVPPAPGNPEFRRAQAEWKDWARSSFAQNGFTSGQRVALWESCSSEIPGRALCLRIKKQLDDMRDSQRSWTHALSFQLNWRINAQHKALHTVGSWQILVEWVSFFDPAECFSSLNELVKGNDKSELILASLSRKCIGFHSHGMAAKGTIFQVCLC